MERTASPTAGYIETDLRQSLPQSQTFKELYFLNSQGKIFISTNEALLNADQLAETYFKEGLMGSYITPLQQTPQLVSGSDTSNIMDRFAVILSMPVIDAMGRRWVS